MESWIWVAGSAIGREIGKVIINMAFCTFQADMGTSQGELRF
jgi:hypothetical protein